MSVEKSPLSEHNVPSKAAKYHEHLRIKWAGKENFEVIHPKKSQKDANFSELSKNDKEDTIDSLPIFSPPGTSSFQLMTERKAIPDFIRVLEPEYYDEIQKRTATQVDQQTNPHKKSKQDEKSIGTSAIKHTLNTIHLQFPGNCVFVSQICHSE